MGIGWGVGIGVWNGKADSYFFHIGVDAGFESDLMAYEKGGEGAVVMTNAQDGERLALEVMRSIAVEYGWPDGQPKVKTAVAVDPKILGKYVGMYEVEPGSQIAIKLKDGHLMDGTDESEEALIPESSTKFAVPDGNELEFVTDARGKVGCLVLHQHGQDHKAMKK
jgi:hypothetical protein